MISFDDFKKLNIVVGTVENAEEIDGSEKLYKFGINLGDEIRQIIGGLKPSYAKDQLIGKQVLILENLEPQKLMGLESQGMILCASDENGKAIIITPEKPVNNGSQIK